MKRKRAMLDTTIDQGEVRELLASTNGREPANLIPILQEIQKRWGYLPREAMQEVARYLKISQNTIYGVATFYSQFKFTPQGEHTVKVCMGTACHVRGSPRILETLERELGIVPGETTKDHKFSLERVNCLGCCALGPVVVIDEEYHGKASPTHVSHVLNNKNDGRQAER